MMRHIILLTLATLALGVAGCGGETRQPGERSDDEVAQAQEEVAQEAASQDEVMADLTACFEKDGAVVEPYDTDEVGAFAWYSRPERRYVSWSMNMYGDLPYPAWVTEGLTADEEAAAKACFAPYEDLP